MCFLKMYNATLIRTNLRVGYPEKDFTCSKHIKLIKNGNVPFHTLSTFLFSMVNSAFSNFEFELSSSMDDRQLATPSFKFCSIYLQINVCTYPCSQISKINALQQLIFSSDLTRFKPLKMSEFTRFNTPLFFIILLRYNSSNKNAPLHFFQSTRFNAKIRTFSMV